MIGKLIIRGVAGILLIGFFNMGVKSIATATMFGMLVIAMAIGVYFSILHLSDVLPEKKEQEE